MAPSLSPALRRAAAKWWTEAVQVPLFLAALLSPPLDAGGVRPWHLLWAAALSAAALSAFLRLRRASGDGERARATAALCALLLVKALVYAGGGARSPLWPLYFLYLAAASLYLGRWWQQAALVLLIALLEAVPALLFPGPAGWRGEPGLWGALLILGAFSLALRFLYLRRQARLEAALEEHGRLREEAESFRRLEEGRTEVKLESHSQEGAMIRRMSNAERLNRDLDRLLNLTRRALGARAVVLFLRDGNRMVLRRGACGEAKAAVASWCRIGEGILGGVAKLGQSVTVSSLERGRLGVEYLPDEEPARSVMVVPVKEQGVVRGVLLADHPGPDRFGKGEREVFEGFSVEMNLVLERLRESAMRDRRGMTSETLRNLSEALMSSLKMEDMIELLVKRIRVVVPYDQCAVFLVDRERQRIVLQNQQGFRFEPGSDVSFPMKRGLVGYVIDHGHPLLFSDHPRADVVPGYPGEERMRSFMGLPLSFRDEFKGAMIFASARPGSFTSYHLDMLTTLSNQVAVQISNTMLHREMERLALTDGLTGLYNHRHFQERMENEMKRAERTGQPLSLLLLDIDHFKKLNDTYGHPFGDVVLKGVSHQLSLVARSIDFVARYGGEEFAVILASTDRRGARNMAERVLKVVRSLRFDHEDGDVRTTVSVGSATFPDDGATKEEIIRHCDQALYRAKSTGRDRHESFEDAVRR